MKTLQYIIFSLIFTAALYAQPLSVMTTVDKNPVAVGQQLVLKVEYTGEAAQKVGQPQLPDMGGFFRYLASGGTSQNISFVNGKMSVTKSFTFVYLAEKDGEFTIPPINASYKGKDYTSKPITIKILATQSVQPRSAQQSKEDVPNKELFLEAYVDKSTVYQGEPVLLTFKVYFAVSMSQYSVLKNSETQGFWVESFDIPQKPVVESEVINGKHYNSAVIGKMALFPTSPGEKTIGPMSLQCNVTVQRQRSRDIFDSFFDDPFFGRTVQKTITSNPIKIKVLPFPVENKPADFNGAVGSYKLSASVDKHSVETDEAVALKVALSGTGNIKMLPTPHVQIPPDFERYDPKVAERISRQNNAVTGGKTWEYVLVPRFPGEQKIKPIHFSYFDPNSKQYKTLKTPEMVVNVRKGNDQFSSNAGTGLSKEEVQLVGQDIRFIKLQAEKFYRSGWAFHKTPVFYLLAFLPLVFIAIAFGYKGHFEKLQDNAAYARSKKANAMAMKRLSKAKALRHVDSQKEFFAEVADALIGFVTDKLNMPKAGYVSEQVEKALTLQKVPQEEISEFFTMLKICDYKRFASAQTEQTEMDEFFQKAKELIVKLEKTL